MIRRMLLVPALAAAALAVPAPAANAGPVCAMVMLRGAVNQTVGDCLWVSPGTVCQSQFLSFPPSSSVEVLVCVPRPFAGR